MTTRAEMASRLDGLEDLFAEGFSYAQAAADLGMSVRSVENYAKKLNQRKRERGEAMAATLRPAVPLRSASRWQDWAACRGHGDLFFGPEGERLADRQAREAAAVTLCEWCPVRRECGVAGMAQEYGTWGGLTEADRAEQRANHHQEERAA
jgi:WhiB family transcriptional regulator, redox-sensing transcriptional regulator